MSEPVKTQDEEDVNKNRKTKKRFASSWDAKQAGAEEGTKADYLSNLGQAQEYNINVTHGQNSKMIDHLFTGNVLGHESDIADGRLRGYEFRSLNNIVGDYYVSPRFLEAVAMHIVKNWLVDNGWLDNTIRVPLILGIWGGKGQGKSFQTELTFKKLGIEPIIMSAGELESEWAGAPGRLIRDRYRRAAEVAKVRGKLPCLMINDLDAGVGIQEGVQRTVNNQMVSGTLMNLCDNPNRVSVFQVWRDSDLVQRVPIIVTGNDFSTLFAPLVRDGRMAKFYWEPDRVDLLNICHQMYKDDGLSMGDMELILDSFKGQSLDFFGAMRSATYDNQIRDWIKEIVEDDINAEGANLQELSRRLINREGLPTFEPVKLHVEDLLKEGRRLAAEQDAVMRLRLSDEYMKNTGKKGQSLVGLQG
ncbi:g3892 [Coccomyxa viridis]|uniref:Ribulose bisphosphate carboxylase/oxygenase activase, chloroplastic n=1 Tax=Coccomyxa viridis TaxID=1274662 RepID=A0ABP1FNY8_9CHLO